MDENNSISLNDQNKRDLKSIILNNKKIFLTIFLISLIGLFGYFFYTDYKKNLNVKNDENYNLAVTNFDKNNKTSTIMIMKNIISIKDPTYSTLALYFLLDNNLLSNKKEINKYFDILIYETNLEKEVKDLIIYKKGLYNSGSVNEQELLDIFKPIINGENLWKSHALYIIAEYFLARNEKQKAKEFFEKIISSENTNLDINKEVQKRLIRDFSE